MSGCRVQPGGRIRRRTDRDNGKDTPLTLRVGQIWDLSGERREDCSETSSMTLLPFLTFSPLIDSVVQQQHNKTLAIKISAALGPPREHHSHLLITPTFPALLLTLFLTKMLTVNAGSPLIIYL